VPVADATGRAYRVRRHGPITALRDFRSPAPNGGADQPGLIASAYRPRVCPRCDAAVLHEVAVQLALVIEPNCVCGLSAVIAAPKSVACWLKTEVREVLMRRETERRSEASNQPLLRAAFGRLHEVVECHCLAGPRMQQIAGAAKTDRRRIVSFVLAAGSANCAISVPMKLDWHALASLDRHALASRWRSAGSGSIIASISARTRATNPSPATEHSGRKSSGIRVIPIGATLNYGPRITSWRDSVVPDEVSIHLTLIIESDGVSHFSAVVAVPQELACLV
jgi:hypothetical protein